MAQPLIKKRFLGVEFAKAMLVPREATQQSGNGFRHRWILSLRSICGQHAASWRESFRFHCRSWNVKETCRPGCNTTLPTTLTIVIRSTTFLIMNIRLNQFRVPLDYESTDLPKRLARVLRVPAENIVDVKVVRRSVDARSRHNPPVFSLTLEVKTTEDLTLPKGAELISSKAQPASTTPARHHPQAEHRPLVVGAGPAGLMAALTLAEAGLNPLLIERGAPAGERVSHVQHFFETGTLNPESNVLYGEGGAGLFSDGKLTASGKDRSRIRRFMEVLVECGAPSDILIDTAPHIGSDVLLGLVPALRQRVIDAGGQVRFYSLLEGLSVEDGAIKSTLINGHQTLTSHCILATGHSARDVYQMLSAIPAALVPKPFAMGVRIELPQSRIDYAQWGRWTGHCRLGAAGFRLTRRPQGNTRACYSFCMCPGGTVIPCAASPGELITNGMSLSKRDLPFGNAAFLVPVTPDDFPSDPQIPGPLAGLRLQRQIERSAFAAAGSDYSIPSSLLQDFLQGATPESIPEQRSWTHSTPVNIREILPDFITHTLATAIPKMLAQLDRVKVGEALVYAPETRSSSPVRIARGESGQSENIDGLYPCGEGSGYAGGIVSSAIDGMQAAQQLIRAL